ncbi:MAG: thioredoxin fold domain-containing protein [Campylobacterales bacterium]|nr:thioredoxin fold domain-containing protein [Campylobacterales bacterium]
MKRLILAVLCAAGLLGGTILQDGAFIQAAASGKTVLMLYSTKGCPECAYMKEKVFIDPEVAERLTRDFVIIEKDINRDELPEGFAYIGIPTLFVLDANGSLIETVIGSRRAGVFAQILDTIKEAGR